jgi:hypothetical protein
MSVRTSAGTKDHLHPPLLFATMPKAPAVSSGDTYDAGWNKNKILQ